jgi:ssDNA thymidine ADP-ribosyltransferase, DarT
MEPIKKRRLTELKLASHPELFVGQCVPFYFSPCSVMLFMIHKKNAGLTYEGGQDSIVHLQADFHQVIAWANQKSRRWAFTGSHSA